MTRELQPALVRLPDRCAQRFTADIRICLEPGHALVRPVIDNPSRFFRAKIWAIVAAPPAPVRYGPVRCIRGPGNLTVVDAALHVDLVIRRRAPGGPHGREAAAQIQPRRGELQLHATTTCRVEGVIVHADQARNDCVTRQIERAGAGWYFGLCRRTDADDLAVLNHDSCAVDWRGARAIDDTHVGQRHRAFGNDDVLADIRRQRTDGLRGQCRGRQRQQKDDNRSTHGSTSNTIRMPVSMCSAM